MLLCENELIFMSKKAKALRDKRKKEKEAAAQKAKEKEIQEVSYSHMIGRTEEIG